MIQLLVVIVLAIIIFVLPRQSRKAPRRYDPRLLNRTTIQGVTFNDSILSKYLSVHFYKKHDDKGQAWFVERDRNGLGHYIPRDSI